MIMEFIDIHELPDKIRLREENISNLKGLVTSRSNDVQVFPKHEEDEFLQKLQMYLRAGMRDEIEKNEDFDTKYLPFSQFLIEFNSKITSGNYYHYGNFGETVRGGNRPNKTSGKDSLPRNNVDVEKGLPTSDVKVTRKNASKRWKHVQKNTTLTVNALQLAILSQQSESIRLILENIFSDSDEQEVLDSLKKVLGEKVCVRAVNASQNSVVSSMKGMNTLHLGCQYYRNSITLIHTSIENWVHKIKEHDIFRQLRKELQSLLLEKTDSMQDTPIHIAVKNSLEDEIM